MKTLYAVLAVLALAIPPAAEAQSMICKIGYCFTFPGPTSPPAVCYDALKRPIPCTSSTK